MKKMMLIGIMIGMLLSVSVDVFACGHDGEPNCNGPFDVTTSGLAEGYVNKVVGDEHIGAAGEAFSKGSYDGKAPLSIQGDATATASFEASVMSDANSATVSGHSTAVSTAGLDTVQGPSVVSQENFAWQSNGATIIHNDMNGFSAGNTTSAETSGSTHENCSESGISITGSAVANGFTNGLMESGENFNKTSVETGGNAQVIGTSGHVEGNGAYAGNAGVKSGSSTAYGEFEGTWKFSGTTAGSGLGGGTTAASITETQTSVSATATTSSYSTSSGTKH